MFDILLINKRSGDRKKSGNIIASNGRKPSGKSIDKFIGKSSDNDFWRKVKTASENELKRLFGDSGRNIGSVIESEESEHGTLERRNGEEDFDGIVRRFEDVDALLSFVINHGYHWEKSRGVLACCALMMSMLNMRNLEETEEEEN